LLPYNSDNDTQLQCNTVGYVCDAVLACSAVGPALWLVRWCGTPVMTVSKSTEDIPFCHLVVCMPRYASQHVLSQFPRLEIGKVVAGRASGIIAPSGAWLGFPLVPFSLGWASSLCGCCRPASGHTVRGMSESRPVINREPHQTQN